MGAKLRWTFDRVTVLTVLVVTAALMVGRPWAWTHVINPWLAESPEIWFLTAAVWTGGSVVLGALAVLNSICEFAPEERAG